MGTQPVRFFVVEYLREAAFELLGDELPYSFTAEVEEFREAAEPVYIRASLFAERESQKGTIIARNGAMINNRQSCPDTHRGLAGSEGVSRVPGESRATLAQE